MYGNLEILENCIAIENFWFKGLLSNRDQASRNIAIKPDLTLQ